MFIDAEAERATRRARQAQDEDEKMALYKAGLEGKEHAEALRLLTMLGAGVWTSEVFNLASREARQQGWRQGLCQGRVAHLRRVGRL